MSKVQRLIGFVLVAGTALAIVVLYSPPPPLKSIEFTVQLLPATNGFSQHCGVMVSNTLDSLVVCAFAEGFKAPALQTAYLTNGIWCLAEGRHSLGGGGGVFRPHQLIACTVEVPAGATAMKVGLFVTPLSWRGRLGWEIITHRELGVLDPLGRFLLEQDTGSPRRSRTEWSSPVQVTTGRAAQVPEAGPRRRQRSNGRRRRAQ